MRLSRLQLLIGLFILPGFFFAAYRCFLRMAVESRDLYVETVTDFEELRTLAREDGWSLGDMLDAVGDCGAGSVGISEDTLNSLESEGRISILNFQEVQKLSSFTPSLTGEVGSLWVYSKDQSLLDRIQWQLSLKLPPGRFIPTIPSTPQKSKEWRLFSGVVRADPNYLVIRKSGADFKERVGLGFSPEYLGLAKQHGLGIVLRIFNFPELSAESISRIIESLPDPQTVSAIIFAEEEVLGNRGKIDATIACLQARPFRIGWVEFNDQLGMDQLLAGVAGRVPIVKVHSIGRKEMDELYTVDRAKARWIRAVRDRRLKMLYIRFFFQDKKKFISDLCKFNLDYLSGIVEKLHDAGFQIPRDNISRKEEPRADIPPIGSLGRLFMGISLFMGFPLLAAISRKRGFDERLAIFPLIAASAIFAGSADSTYTAVSALIGAICFSSIGCIWAIVRLEEALRENGYPHEGVYTPKKPWMAFVFRGSPGIILESVKFFCRLILPGLLGGVLIAGMHSDSAYLLKFLQFRGIKTAFMIPLLWVGFWSLRRYGGGLLAFFSRPFTFRDLFIGLVVVSGTALYLLRSGNVTFLKPFETEDAVRTFLENLLVARPRNKEFLIGYPAVFFFLFFRFRNISSILPICALFIQMGQVSLLNTFCHFHSPLSMAWIRGFNGLWTGWIVGSLSLVAYGICRVIARAGQKDRTGFLVGYFGFGNFGDELLQRVFVKQARKLLPDYRWHILTQETSRPYPQDGVYTPEKPGMAYGFGGYPQDGVYTPEKPGMAYLFGGSSEEGVIPVLRQSPLLMLERIASAKLVVVPGGGLLQSVTSSRSLLYYLFILALGKILGAKLLMPCQGIGPWKPREETVPSTFQPQLLLMGTRLILDFADYLSLRDAESEKFLHELPPPALSATVSADLAFLAEVPRKADPREGSFLLGVNVRGSHASAGKIVDALQQWVTKNEKARIVPLALQEEDESPWKSLQIPVRLLTADSIEQPMNHLSDIHVIVAMRLHACIAATLFGIPWIGLSYDPKIRGFSKKIGWDFISAPEEFSPALLEEMLKKISEQREALQAKLAAICETERTSALNDLQKCLIPTTGCTPPKSNGRCLGGASVGDATGCRVFPD